MSEQIITYYRKVQLDTKIRLCFEVWNITNCQKLSLDNIGQILVKMQFCAVAKECFTIEQPCRGLMDANIREITLDIRLDPLENPTRDLMNRVQFDKIFVSYFFISKFPLQL